MKPTINVLPISHAAKCFDAPEGCGEYARKLPDGTAVIFHAEGCPVVLAEAKEFRAAHDADAAKLTRMSKARLNETLTAEQASRGIIRISGTYSKDELISAILSYRYPRDEFNWTTHVLYHKPGEIWDGCEFCTGTEPGCA